MVGLQNLEIGADNDLLTFPTVSYKKLLQYGAIIGILNDQAMAWAKFHIVGYLYTFLPWITAILCDSDRGSAPPNAA